MVDDFRANPHIWGGIREETGRMGGKLGHRGSLKALERDQDDNRFRNKPKYRPPYSGLIYGLVGTTIARCG
jgi:hypothetical protein